MILLIINLEIQELPRKTQGMTLLILEHLEGILAPTHPRKMDDHDDEYENPWWRLGIPHFGETTICSKWKSMTQSMVVSSKETTM